MQNDTIWTAVFGAAVADQVYDQIRLGYGPPDETLMDGIVEDAATVADNAIEALDRLAPECPSEDQQVQEARDRCCANLEKILALYYRRVRCTGETKARRSR